MRALILLLAGLLFSLSALATIETGSSTPRSRSSNIAS